MITLSDMDNILNLCKKYKLSLIEDSAETLGAKFKNKYTGTFGIGCFSFFLPKILQLLRVER